eukprot:gene41563-50722_t
MTDARVRALSLYRSILKTHITKLPLDLRHLGSSYVRNEFKLHKGVKDSKVLAQFYAAWEGYLEQLKLQADRGRRFGSDLTDKEQKAMSDSQREKMEQLKVEVVTARCSAAGNSALACSSFLLVYCCYQAFPKPNAARFFLFDSDDAAAADHQDHASSFLIFGIFVSYSGTEMGGTSSAINFGKIQISEDEYRLGTKTLYRKGDFQAMAESNMISVDSIVSIFNEKYDVFFSYDHDED